MTAQPSGVRRGFQMVCRQPQIIVFEIAWRWAFGLGALIIFGTAAERLLASVPVTNGDIAALHSRDSTMIAIAALHIWTRSGVQLARVFAIVVISISLLWLLASAVGRIITLSLLLGPWDGETRPPRLLSAPNYAGVFGISFLRMLGAWIAIVLCAAAIAGSAYVGVETGSDPARPNFAVYFLLLLLILPIVLVAWAAVNWYLSLAPVFCVSEGARAMEAAWQAKQRVACARRKFLAASAGYTLPRLVALVLLIVFAALTARAFSSNAAIAIIVVLSLAYFALADFFYLARLAAYAELLKQPPAERAVSATAQDPLTQSQ